MWKKDFSQNKTLLSYVEKNSNPDSILHQQSRQVIRQEINTITQSIHCDKCDKYEDSDESDDEMYIEDEDDTTVEQWDALHAKRDEWTHERFGDFLCQSPDAVPVLKRIIREQKNVYGFNSSFLCEFQAIDGPVEIWVQGTIL